MSVGSERIGCVDCTARLLGFCGRGVRVLNCIGWNGGGSRGDFGGA